MSWGRNDDRFPQNRKIVALSDAAFRLYVTARDYANAEGTDGFLAGAVVPGLTRAPQGAALRRVLAELTTVQAGETHPLWETAPGGYRIHDFLVYNLSRAETSALRAARNEVKAAGGRARARHAQRHGGKFTSKSKDGAPADDQQPTSSAPAAHQQGHQQPTSSRPAADQQRTSPVPVPVPVPAAPTEKSFPESPVVGVCRCDPPARLDEESLQRHRRLFPAVAEVHREAACRWWLQRGGNPDLRDLARVCDELIAAHGHDDFRAHFARLTDPTMPATQFRFHSLRTFAQNFLAYGPSFDPSGKPPQRVGGGETDWNREVSDVSVG